jgi:hypothetical protein
MKMAFFLVILLFNLVEFCRRFRGACHLHHQGYCQPDRYLQSTQNSLYILTNIYIDIPQVVNLQDYYYDSDLTEQRSKLPYQN